MHIYVIFLVLTFCFFGGSVDCYSAEKLETTANLSEIDLTNFQTSSLTATQLEDEKSRALVLCDEFPDFLPTLASDHPKMKILGIFPKSIEDRKQELIKCENVYYLSNYRAAIYDKVLSCLKSHSFSFILAPRETDLIMAAELREQFSIEGDQTLPSALIFCNKLRMKDALVKHNLTVPVYSQVNKEEDIERFIMKHEFPIVFKPSQASGSRGVHILHTYMEWQKCKNHFSEISSTYGEIEVEKFVPGEMYHVDGILHKGAIKCIWPSKYITPCAEVSYDNFDGSFLLSEKNPLKDKLCDFVNSCLQALQYESQHLLNSAFHVEVFHNKLTDKITFCEAASRVGGCRVAEIWEQAFGINLLNENVRSRMGKESVLTQPTITNQLVGSLYIPVRKGIIKNIPDSCPLDGIIGYTSFYKTGNLIEYEFDTDGFKKKLVFSFVEAPTEEEMLTRIQLFRKWFYGQVSWVK